MAIDLATIAAGIGGFIIHGQDAGDWSGYSVSSAGDINGDGFDDVLIGAFRGNGPGNTRNFAGNSYVVYGKEGRFEAALDLAALASGAGGFVIHGQDEFDISGFSVSSAGDINGDGFDDLLIGAYRGDGPANTRGDAGDSYVLFGIAAGFAGAIDLAALTPGGGFVIHGQDANDQSGLSVSTAGDINGDGVDDLLIGAEAGDGPSNTRNAAGDTYLVFGRSGGVGTAIDLAAVAAGIGGFVVHGQDTLDFSGHSVSSAGDINGDGFDDLLIGANLGDGPGDTRDRAGDSYVVFGKRSGFGAAVDLAAVAAGVGGFVIHGQDAGDESGRAVSSAGDINGDGFDDLIIGANGGDGPSNGSSRAGDSYVVFGKGSGFGAAIDLAIVAAGMGGFVIRGQERGDSSGWSVSSAGDVNGDGFDDLIVGAPFGDGPGNTRIYTGHSYVVFGKAGGFGAAIDLAAVAAGTGGFVIYGQDAYDQSGRSVSSAGDIDGDGFDDLIIGNNVGDGPGNTRSYAGDSYLVFGAATIDGSVNHVTHLGTGAGETLTGNAAANVMVGGRGDDTLRGAGGADVLRGGQGNDVLSIADARFARIVGGTGADVLAFAGAMTLGDTHFRRVSEIESIKLANAATNLTLGAIAAHAIEGLAANSFRITIDASSVTNAAVTINGGALNRPLSVNLSGDATAVTLIGGSGADGFIGGSGADVLTGNAGGDTLDGRGGSDTMTGGAGNDLFFVGAGGDVTNEAAGGGTDRVFASVSYTLKAGSEIETLSTIDHAGLGAINLTGNGFANLVAGNAGENWLDGAAGADSLIGFGGDDFFFVDNAGDAISEGAGQGTGDRVFASVSYTLGAGDQVEIMSTTNIGGNGAINLTGNELANLIYGNAGQNTLDGAGGDDRLLGVAGIDTLRGMGGSDRLEGGDGADRLFGGADDDRLYGQAGADQTVGGTGNDWHFVTDAGDTVIEAAGEGALDRVFASVSYTLAAGAEIENFSTSLHAGTGSIDLIGNALANLIFGNAGSNVINGRAGNDRLLGFGGSDAFLFDTALNAATNVDRIGDFAAANDAIRLDDAIFTGLGGPGPLNDEAFYVGASATETDDRIVYDRTTGALSYDADGSNPGAAIRFATLSAGLALTEANFVVV